MKACGSPRAGQAAPQTARLGGLQTRPSPPATDLTPPT